MINKKFLQEYYQEVNKTWHDDYLGKRRWVNPDDTIRFLFQYVNFIANVVFTILKHIAES